MASDSQVVDQMIRLGAWLRTELQQFARQQNATLIDAYEKMPPRDEILGDYIHLTAEGEQQLAVLLADALQPLLHVEP